MNSSLEIRAGYSERNKETDSEVMRGALLNVGNGQNLSLGKHSKITLKEVKSNLFNAAYYITIYKGVIIKQPITCDIVGFKPL